MEEKEIKSLDLRSIYRLIDIHAEMNSSDKSKKKKKNNPEDEEGAYIDNILF